MKPGDYERMRKALRQREVERALKVAKTLDEFKEVYIRYVTHAIETTEGDNWLGDSLLTSGYCAYLLGVEDGMKRV